MYKIYDVKCNDMTSPVGINTPQPCFSWKLESDLSNIVQSAYKITVSNDDHVVWDSGEVSSECTNGILYQGKPLMSGKTYSCCITSISNQCEEAFDCSCTFTTGLMDFNDFRGQWIWDGKVRKESSETTEMWKVFAGMIPKNEHPENILDAPVCFNRRIFISDVVKNAVCYITALGIYELSVDGNVISDILAPGYSNYGKQLEVQTYDIGKYLTKGEHTLSVILADGWYTGKIGLVGIGYQYGEHNALAYQIDICYENGICEQLISDGSCTWSDSHYTYADLFIGECYDEQSPCEKEYPVQCESADTGIFRGRTADPVKIIKTLKPEILITPKGELVLDFKENLAGVAEFYFNASADTTVSFTHSEVLDKDGNFMENIIGQNKNQTDVFVCRQNGSHDYKPKFTFHGFRYVKIQGIDAEQLIDAKAFAFSSMHRKTSSFTCSHDGLNRLQENIERSQDSNMLSIPTDCPQRERAGWTGDMQIFSDTACFNRDVKAFLSRWLSYMRDEQLADGQIPNVIPDMDSMKYMSNSQDDHISSTGWADACIIVPYSLYRKYGDISCLKDNYTMMTQWMNYAEAMAAKTDPPHLWNTDFHFGDWLFPSASSRGIFNPAETAHLTKMHVAPLMHAYSAQLMIEISHILGYDSDTDKYKKFYENIKTEFVQEYFDADAKLSNELQGLYVLALKTGCVPEGKKGVVLQHLIRLIHENQDCLDTGFLAVPFLLDVLYDNEHKDLAYKILFQTKCPSWLYEIEQGATTIWESWSAITEDGTRTSASYNHFAFGCVGDFIYRKILGITETAPGYKKVRIAPDLECGLTYAKGYFDCEYGKIQVSWKCSDGKMTIEGSLPPNITGTLLLNGKEYQLGSGRFSY